MSKKTPLPRADADSAWKDMLDAYFEEFMRFFFPELAKEINWAAGYEIMDKELNAITTGALVGKRLVDKLVKVESLSGEERWALCHVEVQGSKEAGFGRRLFEYYYRLYDRYRKPIVTIAVLADGNPSWRPAAYQAKAWGSEFLLFRYFTVKLLDYAREKDKLLETSNPFGTVALAFLAAQQTRKDIELRYQEKYRLTRRLYGQGLNHQSTRGGKVRELHYKR